MLVCYNLNFDVLHACQILLQIYSSITKRLLRLLLCGRNLLNQRGFVLSYTNSFTPAAGSRFNNNRITDIASYHNSFIQILYKSV
ncbi:hypothetical protein D3C78_1294770 [compost metagenome]